MRKRSFLFYTILLFNGLFSNAYSNEVAARNIVEHYDVNLTPILLEKCIVDVGSSILSASSGENTDSWIPLAVELCGSYFLNEICTFAREKMIYESNTEQKVNNQGSALGMLVAPAVISGVAFTALKISELLHFNKDYTKFFTSQIFSAGMLINNIKNQIFSLNQKIDNEVKPKLIDTIIKIGMKYFPTLTSVARFLHIDRMFGFDMNPKPIQLDNLSSRRATFSEISKTILAGVLFVASKITNSSIKNEKHPWLYTCAKLLEMYGKNELYKTLYLANKNNKTDLIDFTDNPQDDDELSFSKILSSALTPITIVSGTILIKNLASVTNIDDIYSMFAAYGIGLVALWLNDLNIHKDDIEKKIVGYNTEDLTIIYSLIRKLIPALPDISDIFSDTQSLAFSIAYPKAMDVREIGNNSSFENRFA